jgi:hypothetical protein
MLYRRLALRAMALAPLLAFSCGPESHPPPMPEMGLPPSALTEGGTPISGGLPPTGPSLPGGSVGGTPTGGSGGSGGSGGGGGSNLPLSASMFDHSKIFMWGTLDEIECNRDAVAWINAPNTYTVGFECYGYNPYLRSGHLLYQDSERGNGVFEFVADDVQSGPPGSYVYPASPQKNDIPIATPGCPPPATGKTGGPLDYLVGPTGRMIHACSGTAGVWVWYDEKGIKLRDEMDGVLVYALGNGDVVLTSRGVMSLSDGIIHDPKLPSDMSSTIYAVRAYSTGFHVVLMHDFTITLELWELTDGGTSVKVGAYPASPVKNNGPGVLGPDDAFYNIADDGTSTDVIVRRTIGGAAEIVYTEASDPNVRLDSSVLFTGP